MVVLKRPGATEDDTSGDEQLLLNDQEDVADDDGRPRPCLIAISGPDSGRTTSLDQREILIGRSHECDIQILDRTVSRHHARLYVISGDVELFDLDSRDGVTVNGERAQRCRLAPEDIIRFGRSSSFRFAYVTKAEKDSLQKLFDLAVRDPLTGLFNRNYFTTVLDRLLSVTSDRPAAMLMLDLDHFKQVNDSFGHPVGDLVLAHIANLLAAETRGQDLAARYGGEEFLMLLHNLSLDGGVRVAERIRNTVESSPLFAGGEKIAMTVSIGVASTLEAGGDSRLLVELADRRLAMAKHQGRNRTCALAVSDPG
jgi:diguanylate cyclase (GGDEF)-like protein